MVVVRSAYTSSFPRKREPRDVNELARLLLDPRLRGGDDHG